MTNRQKLFMELIEDDNKSELAKYYIIWDNAQRELLEEIRKDFKNTEFINVDKYINKKLGELTKYGKDKE